MVVYRGEILATVFYVELEMQYAKNVPGLEFNTYV